MAHFRSSTETWSLSTWENVTFFFLDDFPEEEGIIFIQESDEQNDKQFIYFVFQSSRHAITAQYASAAAFPNPTTLCNLRWYSTTFKIFGNNL